MRVNFNFCGNNQHYNTCIVIL